MKVKPLRRRVRFSEKGARTYLQYELSYQLSQKGLLEPGDSVTTHIYFADQLYGLPDTQCVIEMRVSNPYTVLNYAHALHRGDDLLAGIDLDITEFAKKLEKMTAEAKERLKNDAV